MSSLVYFRVKDGGFVWEISQEVLYNELHCLVALDKMPLGLLRDLVYLGEQAYKAVRVKRKEQLLEWEEEGE